MPKFFKLVICLLIPLTAGGIAGYVTSSSIGSWYADLNKPSFNPPDYLFGPVWAFLYVLMGISLYLIWQSPKSRERKVALTVFGIQLVLNFAWSFIFFYFHEIGFALVEILILWIAILVMIVQFYKVQRTAAYLQIPYLLWVSFALILTAAIFYLN